MRRLALALAALAALHVVLALPAHPDHLRPASWAMLHPELPVLILVLLALGTGAAGGVLRWAVVVVLTVISTLRIADMAMLETLGRRFNPVADLPLIDASVRLIAGSLGVPAAIALTIAAILAVAGIAATIWAATGVWTRMGAARPATRVVTLACACLVGAALTLPSAPMAVTTAYAHDRAQLGQRTLSELRQFRIDAQTDPVAALPGLLGRIDRDVLVIFLESYGRTSFDTPFYAERHLNTLAEAQRQLGAAGLAMRSGFATSPTHGGQSWLAHATLANGLWINDQTRYQAALASGRRTLFHLAAQAGFRTAAVMPAIVRPWPEAATMGFQTIFAAPDLDYQGLAFNWVTMPDQFTLAATDRLVRAAPDPRPLFAQIALISSHAPWTPVPHLLDWEALGDGTEFNQMALSGDPPNVVWSDRETVREHYRDTIDYTLRTVLEYAERHAARPPLMLLVGDHQAASSISLDERREIPIHVIGPPELVELTAEWGLAPGLIPPAGQAALPMEGLRDRILRSFSGTGDVPPA